MDQIKIGKYITKKRKEINITQEQLAEKIGISSKAISKWECGKSLPDYSSIELVCKELGITVSELLNGEDEAKNEDRQMLEMLERIQRLENQKKIIFGVLLIILGIACFCMSQTFGGSDFKDFVSGLLLGLSIGEMIVGIFVVAGTIAKQ